MLNFMRVPHTVISSPEPHSRLAKNLERWAGKYVRGCSVAVMVSHKFLQGDASGFGPGAAMDAALARLNRAEEDVAALREAIKVGHHAPDLAPHAHQTLFLCSICERLPCHNSVDLTKSQSLRVRWDLM